VLFFSVIERSVLMTLAFYGKDMLGKGTIQRAQQFSAFLCYRKTPQRTQLNAAHAQLHEKLRPIALAETCPFLTIHWLELQEIWQKYGSENT